MDEQTLHRSGSPAFRRLNPLRTSETDPKDKPAPAGRNWKAAKFRNQPTTYNGRTYHSKAEADRAQQLDQLKSAGVILDWEPQPKFFMVTGKAARSGFVLRREGVITYAPDFLVWDTEGCWAEDVKGAVKQRDRDIAKLWQEFGPVELRWLKNGRITKSIPPGNPRIIARSIQGRGKKAGTSSPDR